LETANVGNVGLDAKKRRHQCESEHYSVGGVRFTDTLEFKLEQFSCVRAYRRRCGSAVNTVVFIFNSAA
jgi:hypothetical protein